MPLVAFAVQAMYTMYAVYTMAAIMMTTYGVVTAAQQKSKAASERSSALKSYYNQLAKGKTQSQAFASSKGSFKDVRMQASKYSGISEQLIQEAQAREKVRGSRQSWAGYKPRTSQQMMQDFGLVYAGKSIDMGTEEIELSKQDLFKPYNFGVENFNNNL